MTATLRRTASTAPADNAAPAPKSEDRIAQVLQDADKGTNADVVAVAPRKVRTMVVKSDGSLVPREDPAPAAPQMAAAEPIDPAPQHVAPVGPGRCGPDRHRGARHRPGRRRAGPQAGSQAGSCAQG